MQIAYTPEQEALRKELRTYFAELMTPEVIAAASAGETGSPECLEAVRQMGRDRWLGVGWPEEYGGRGFGPVEQFIFMNESWRAGAPTPFLSVNTVGMTIMQFGTQEQKDFFLPKILAGELHFSIGYTEPNAGTDLASLTTKAVKDGDEWVINGQKIFTSLANYADYIWLAARTDPDAPKHKGITMFLVPTTDPGYSYSKIHTMVNASTFNTFYDDVKVPDSAILGELHGGWGLIINQLNYERVGLAPPGMIERSYEDTLDWARENTTADGQRVIDQEWVQLNLAKVRAGIEYLTLLNWKVAALEAAGEQVNPADASSIKVFGTEFFTEAYQLLAEILGQAANLVDGSPDALLASRLNRGAQGSLILTFGGGVNEIQRDLIAMFGLGMPRMPRM
ncbi:acyl-CoA dehydrogenase family protein [Aquihabitans sp. McL0605]|uniref:acyl-CoA dehydrogenase family protein n=1 Tax=Aquihabitans sp. McL0605 TaxID=3415671 RepID=UPI003CED68B6